MLLTLGFSPCPNDTFIFDAMVHQKIDTEGLVFNVVMEDVETLNRNAFNNKLDVTKLSFHALAYALPYYVLLHAGAALGNNCGPLLIAKEQLSAEQLRDAPVAIPGQFTTANFLLSLAFPDLTNKKEMLFSEIEQAILAQKCAAGVIIHENRFTYQQRGLRKILDLGEFWEHKTSLPIPLGGIVARRSFEPALRQKINRVLQRSVEFAFQNPNSSLPFVRSHAQEMEESVMQQHIKLYVNHFSVDLGEVGVAAVRHFFELGISQKIIPNTKSSIF